MSKGSKQRTTNKLQFDENYDNIVWSKEPKLNDKQIKELIKIVKKPKPCNENNT